MNVVNNSNPSSTNGLADAQQRPYPGNGANSGNGGNAAGSFSDLLRKLDDIHIRVANPADEFGIAQPVQPSPQATPTPADKPASEQATHQADGPSETQRQEARAATKAAQGSATAPATPAVPDASDASQASTEDPACNATPLAQTAQAADDGTEKSEAPDATEEQGRPAHTEPIDERAVRKARTAKLLDTGATAPGLATALHGTAQQDPALAQAARLARAPARDAKADAPADAGAKTEGKEASNIPRKGGPLTGRSDARVADQRADARADAQAAPAGEAAQATPAASASAAIASFASELRSAVGGNAGPQAATDAPGALGALGATAGAHAGAPASSSADASAATTTITLALPVDDAGFGAELGARLAVLTQDGVQHAELHLNPAEMGPVAVQISVDGQQAQVSFHAAHAATRSALEQSLPDLAAALSSAGLTLSGGGVFQQSQGGQGGNGQPGANGTNQRTTGVAGAGAAGSTGLAQAPVRGGPVHALVDLYA